MGGPVVLHCRPMLSLLSNQGAVILYAEPSLCNNSDVGVLCTFSNMVAAAAAAGIARSSQLHSPLSGQAVQYTRWQGVYGPPITVRIIIHPTPFLQLGRAGRRVGSLLYVLRPLWVQLTHVPLPPAALSTPVLLP